VVGRGGGAPLRGACLRQIASRWVKLHLAFDVTTGEITAHVLTEGTADDAAQVSALLERTKGAIASVTTDRSFHGDPTYEAAAARQPNPPPDVVVPPRAAGIGIWPALARRDRCREV
jgi:hypothetical protein